MWEQTYYEIVLVNLKVEGSESLPDRLDRNTDKRVTAALSTVVWAELTASNFVTAGR